MRTLIFFSALFLASCGEEGYFKSSLQLNKVSDDCNDKESHFAMTSNINGERYEFNKCLPENYDEKNCSVRKSHDTVFVDFKNVQVQSTTYKATLDIDTYPRYNYIIIDGNAFVVVPAGN